MSYELKKMANQARATTRQAPSSSLLIAHCCIRAWLSFGSGFGPSRKSWRGEACVNMRFQAPSAHHLLRRNRSRKVDGRAKDAATTANKNVYFACAPTKVF